MKEIVKIALAFCLTLGMVSCDFEPETYQDIPTPDAYTSVQDVENGLNGAYYAFGTYRFYGTNVVAIGDMASDLAIGSQSSGHYANFSRYIVMETTLELEETWDYGYRAIDRCVRTINGAKKVFAEDKNLTDEDHAKLNLYLSQCYSLKALTTFALANIFVLPYQSGGSNLGLPLLKDEPLQPFVKIKRSTLEETYSQIVSEIESAKTLMADALEMGAKQPDQFYLNEAAIYALEARVKLFMGLDREAKTAAEKAIELRASADVSNEIYVTMWSSISITDEDIFTICKTADDNLSANSLNTLYGSYKGAITPAVISALASTDIRAKLIKDTHPKKFDGIPTSQSVNNIPVFRKSEMYLIIAEVEARAGNIEPAQDALFYTAKRNVALEKADLPATSAGLLSFISEERVREFFEEGHRFYNVRRTGELITVGLNKPNFNASAFVYPIPAKEINAGFCSEQNPNWSDALPK